MQRSDSARLRTELHRALTSGALPDGGWPYYRGRGSRLEPTCWALLALAADRGADGRTPLEAGRAFVRRLARPDGLLVERGMPGPNYAWNGLGLLADIASDGMSDNWRESLVAGLLAAKGIALDGASPLGQNNRLQSWSWTDGTFSWIEPTALCVLALKKARASGPLARTRLHEAEAMMFDRVCATGGWNYGNAEVLGQDLRAYVPTTALTLLALQDRRDHPAVVRSLGWLRTHATSERSTMALSLATICLRIFGENDHNTRSALEDQLSTPDSVRGVHVTAMGLCALSSQQGLDGLTVV